MKHITKEQLSILSDLSPLSPFLFNRDEIVYFDKELPDIIERLHNDTSIKKPQPDAVLIVA